MVDRGSRSRRFKQGQNDAFAQGAEFIVTPLLFGFLGWFLDGLLGTAPLLLVLLALFAFIGTGLSNYYRYMAKVERDDEGKPWTRRTR